MNETFSIKNVIVALTVTTVALLLAFVFLVPMSIRNTAADAEVFVVQAKDDCAVTYDNGIKAIIEMASVDTNTKQFLTEYMRTAVGGGDPNVQQAYSDFVNGNPASLMLLMSSISGTNVTATAENVQREVNAQRTQMLVCSKTLNGAQAHLKNVIGMNASGAVDKFPQSMYSLGYPSEVSDATLRDNDGDGNLTVLDYRPPVNVEITGAFGADEGIAPVDPYATVQP